LWKVRYLDDPLEFFPYEPRFGQVRVIKEINNYARDGNIILFDAPTGYGKTPVVLAAILPIAEEYNVPILWAVRTGNETDRPIEELKQIVGRTRRRIFGISIRGKRDMCLLARQNNIRDHEGVSVLCRRMRDKCPFYRNLFYKRLSVKKPLLFSEILKLGIESNICPYFLQLNLARKARVISMSYNYIFSEPIRWSLRSYVRMKNAILVVDEAHNMQNVIASINSDRITLGTVERAINEVSRFNDNRSKRLLEKIKRLYKILKQEAEGIRGEDDIFDPITIISEAELDDEDFSHAGKLVSKIYTRMLKEGKSPRSSLRHLMDFLKLSIEYVELDGIAFLKYKDKNRVVFERWDMRASELLSEIWDYFFSIVFMSGTLKPYNAFSEISGIKHYYEVSDEFKIPRENVVSLIIKDLTTKGEELSVQMKERYITAFKEILPVLEVNTAIFFASYRIMNELIRDVKKIVEECNRNIFVEQEGMMGDEARQILEEFKKSEKNVLCASMQGRFAEGADFPGEALEAIILVGIPFERLTVRTQLYIDYYSRIYGSEKGRFYAYVLPALRRASQALGRALRSSDDKAILIAMDERYRDNRYFRLLPKFFREYAKLVNVPAAIEFIEEFHYKQ